MKKNIDKLVLKNIIVIRRYFKKINIYEMLDIIVQQVQHNSIMIDINSNKEYIEFTTKKIIDGLNVSNKCLLHALLRISIYLTERCVCKLKIGTINNIEAHAWIQIVNNGIIIVDDEEFMENFKVIQEFVIEIK